MAHRMESSSEIYVRGNQRSFKVTTATGPHMEARENQVATATSVQDLFPYPDGKVTVLVYEVVSEHKNVGAIRQRGGEIMDVTPNSRHSLRDVIKT
jgi:hypothetical protein